MIQGSKTPYPPTQTPSPQNQQQHSSPQHEQSVPSAAFEVEDDGTQQAFEPPPEVDPQTLTDTQGSSVVELDHITPQEDNVNRPRRRLMRGAQLRTPYTPFESSDPPASTRVCHWNPFRKVTSEQRQAFKAFMDDPTRERHDVGCDELAKACFQRLVTPLTWLNDDVSICISFSMIYIL